jgi:adenine-specific DNA-methyltransferase
MLFKLLSTFSEGQPKHDNLSYIREQGVKEKDIGGKQVFSVNDDQLLACFDTEVTTEVIEAIAKLKPVYAVFRDASFADDSAAANLEELFKAYSPDTVRKVV